MIGLTVEIDGEQELIAEFDALENTLSDFSTPFKAIQSEFFDIQKEQFQSQGAAGKSGQWQPLSPAYEAVKLAKFGSVQILQASGALYESLTSETSDSIADIQPTEATFGTTLPRGQYHQQGKGRLPVRKPIDPSDAQLERIAERFKKEVNDLVNK